MDQLLDCLCKLNFSSLEAKIYLALLENGKQSGYQIAKKINISRSSIYNAISHMYEQGAILLSPEDVQLYEAQNPSILFARLKKQFSENADFASSNLQRLYEERREDRFVNLKGFDSIVANVKNLLLSAKKEVYVNTDFDLHLFSKELNLSTKKGVRVIVFSFATLEHDGLEIEFYTHNDPVCESEKPSRIMFVADNDIMIVADRCIGKDNWFGTLTNNALMVSIIAEHIHNDIYLLKLKQKYGKNMIDEKIKINTLLERR